MRRLDRCRRAGRHLTLALAVLLVALAGAAETPPPEAPTKGAPTAETVVLLHGLGRSARSMRPLAEALVEAGFEARSLGYPSTDAGPDELVAHVAAGVARCCEDATRLHFVTHSLGGILVRGLIAEQRPPQLGRVVMLAPPNGGSELVDWLGDSELFAAVLGPTAMQLGTDERSLPNRLPPADFELGVIAGVESSNLLGGHVVPGTDDGTVSVESTRLDGMTDHIEVEAGHSFIMRSEEVATLVVRFLRTGRFAADLR